MTLQTPKVVGVRDQTLAAALCVTGRANVVFDKGLLTQTLTSQGALLVVGAARVSLVGTEVTHNTANSSYAFLNTGGGIVAQEKAQVTIKDSTIAYNRVTAVLAALGAAVVAQDHTHVTIANSVIKGNAALAPGLVGYASGGALYADGSAVVDARGVKFTGNVANGTSPSAAGAVCVMHNVTLKLADCLFADNAAVSAATGVGGCLAAMNATLVNITNTTFASNAAFGVSGVGAGGAIFAANEAVIDVTGCRFVGNAVNGTVAGTGGAMASFDSAVLHLRRTVIEGGKVNATSSVTGGGIACFNRSNLLLVDSVVTQNHANSTTAAAGGGGVGLFDSSVARIVRCNVTGNWIKGSGQVAGGGLFAQCPGSLIAVEDSLFDSNSAAAYERTGGFAGGGGVGVMGKMQVSLMGCTFVNNHAAGISGTEGGAVYAAGAVQVSVQSCEFTRNSVAGIQGYIVPSLISCGGALGVDEANSVMSVNGSSFSANIVDGIQTCGGAACAVNSGALRLFGCQFGGNHAAGAMTCGGGVCANNKSKLRIEGVNFTANLASGISQGGAACTASASNATILTSTFRNNQVGWAGGAIGIGDGCYTDIARCAFVNNTATNAEAGCGGAISVGFEALKKDFASCSIDSSRFEGNTAFGRRGSGGAIYTANAAVSISNSSFVANQAQQGGGLGGSGVSWDVRKSVFANHSVIGPGGALFTSGHLNASITGSTISHNRCEKNPCILHDMI